MDLFHARTPDIWERLRNNALATDIETPVIRKSIDIAQTRLIALLLQNQGGPSVEAEYLSSYIAQYSSLLAPIRRLTADILRMIFLDPNIHEKKRDISRESILTGYKPNRLGAVCHRWRCVTLETATMWSGIAVFVNQPSQYSINALRIALRRSQNALLSLLFLSSLLTIDSWSAFNLEMMHEVLQHTERWAVIELDLDENFLPHLSPAQGRLDSLHTLTVHDRRPYKSVGAPVETCVFAVAPRLRTLSIMRFSLVQPLHEMPWSQLTRLCIDGQWNTDDLGLYHHLFSQAQDIRDLSVRLSRIHSEIPAPPQLPVVSPHLQKMILYGPASNRAHEMEVLARATTPALKHLQVIHLNHWDTPIMQAFIERSAFSLHTLVLYLVPVRVNDLLSVLRMLPTVEDLFLQDLIPNAITNATMAALTAPSTEILPALSTFVLSGAYLFGEGPLLAMLQSRIAATNQTAPLTVVDISLPHLILSTPSLQRLNTIHVSTTSFRFSCIDEGRRTTIMKFGAHMGWIHELRLEVLQVKG
ncbi:hypothetical protein R3P38DRAFT_3255169 [Favolaschia claudopus]|uniref:F-box domain-containing protein n=1 Tax=Favolaschia claudopus TaxID=2862362 RepID=A0AAW0DL38_9AGAR